MVWREKRHDFAHLAPLSQKRSPAAAWHFKLFLDLNYCLYIHLMEQKDIWLITIGLLGWSWAVVQFFINRKNQKKDKAIEKRFDVYAAYMKKSDELMEKMRIDPRMMFGVTNEFMTTMLDEKADINGALLKYNSEILEYAKKSTEPLLILNQELSTLFLVCSDDLLPKIQEYKVLANDLSNHFQSVMNTINPKVSDDMIAKLNTIGHDQRAVKLGELNKDIMNMMRKEVGYYNKK